MLKIRRPLGRLIFNMGIAIPGKTVFLIETAPGSPDWARVKSVKQRHAHAHMSLWPDCKHRERPLWFAENIGLPRWINRFQYWLTIEIFIDNLRQNQHSIEKGKRFDRSPAMVSLKILTSDGVPKYNTKTAQISLVENRFQNWHGDQLQSIPKQ